jgi:hypothetical protein
MRLYKQLHTKTENVQYIVVLMALFKKSSTSITDSVAAPLLLLLILATPSRPSKVEELALSTCTVLIFRIN